MSSQESLGQILLQMMPEDMAVDYNCQSGEDDEWKVPDVLAEGGLE